MTKGKNKNPQKEPLLTDQERGFAGNAELLKQQEETRAKAEKNKDNPTYVKVGKNDPVHEELVKDWMKKHTPSVYSDAKKLYDETSAILNKSGEYKIKPETRIAAEQLCADLLTAMTKWENQTRENLVCFQEKQSLVGQVTRAFKEGSVSHIVNENYKTEPSNPYNQANFDQELAHACLNTVKENKNLLMKDPGFWEQIKESINQFTEKYAKTKFFKVKETFFAQQEVITKSVESIANIGKPDPDKPEGPSNH